MQVSFIGLGKMGLPMAKNILSGNFRLTVYNRSPEKAEPLAGAGATISTSPEDAVSNADVVVTMLSDDDALKNISAKIIPVMKKGSVHLSMSTVSPATAKALEQEAAARDIIYLSAPVMGRPPAAEAKQLFILLSGKAAGKEKIHSLLLSMGQRVFDYGEDPASATTVKLMMNYQIFVITEMLSEVMVLAEKTGIDKNTILETMTSTLFGAPIFKNYGNLIIQETNSTNGFTTRLASKDVRLIQETAKSHGATLPLSDVVQKHFTDMINTGRGEYDFAMLVKYLKDKPGN